MTENFYRTKKYKPDHSTFGGTIYKGDYDGYYSMSDIIARIISDKKFDEQCRKNIEGRNFKNRRKDEQYL